MGSNLERVVEQEVKGTVGVRYGEEFFLNSRGMKLFTCRWLPLGKEVRALIFLCHGYGMECSIYMKGVGIRLAQAGYAVFGIDIEGHGKSEGLRCFINNFDCVIDDCVSFFKSVRDRDEYKGKPTFLYGESMGGALALLIHRKEPGSWNGAVLVAPMCKISEKLKPPELVTSILRKLAYVVPTWKIVPSRDIIETGFKNPLKREQIRSNPYIYQDRPRLKTAMELLNASMGLEERLDELLKIRNKHLTWMNIFLTRMSRDVLWENVQFESRYGGSGAQKWKCKLCGEEHSGSGTKLKAHFSHTSVYGMRLCLLVTEAIFNSLQGWKSKMTGIPMKDLPKWESTRDGTRNALHKRNHSIAMDLEEADVVVDASSRSRPRAKRTSLNIYIRKGIYMPACRRLPRRRQLAN